MGSNASTEEASEGPGSVQSQSMASNCEARKLKKPGVSILKEILRRIKLDENLIKENNAILHEFLNSFIAEMKRNDELFNFLYQHCYYTGSFYSDLRVSQPDEFDIDLILKLPFKDSDFEITHQLQTPSYVKYRLKDLQAASVKYPLLVRKLFSEGYLILENVRKWIQSVVDLAMKTYTPPRSIVKVCIKQSGPARTIFLKKRMGQIDIDLVPVIECTLDLPTTNLDKRISARYGSKFRAFMVPKPYSNAKQLPVSQKEVKCLWRSHFPDAEKEIINDIGCVKPLIKLLKLLRDTEDWKILASYYLKTVVMWMILDNPSKDYWKEDKMDERFIEVLQKLMVCMEQQKIPYFFNKKHNLVSKLNTHQAFNVRNRINILIRKIQDNPNSLWNTFQMTPSFINS